MTQRIIGPTGTQRRRWTLIAPFFLVALVALIITAGAQSTAPETAGFVELDKNLHNDLTTLHLGTINSQMLANATTVNICELSPPGAAPNDSILLIDGEYMKVTGRTQLASIPNNCSFTDPTLTAASYATYTVLRAQPAPSGLTGATGSAAIKHPGGSDVTWIQYPDSKVGIDWDDVYAAVSANPTATNPCSALLSGAIKACDWLNDPPGQSIFTGGSSDISDIPGWTWTDSSVPDADEILHAYAAKAQVGTGHQFLYFGADRYAVNGAKDMGFWFFKSPVNAAPDHTFKDDEGNPAHHSVGDILLLGTFTQGGAVTTIRVYKWVGTGGDTSGTLNFGGSFGDCVPGGSADGCNTVNNSTIPSPWAYQGKAPPAIAANVIYGGGMMEGGIDLTSLGLTGCFSSFAAETRSSPSLTAAQKDFALGRFESCGATVVTTPKTGAGGAIASGGLNLGTGATGVTAQDSALLTVNGTDTFTGTLKFFICGPIDNSATCTTGGVPAGTINNVTASGTYASDTMKLTSAANNTTGAPGRYCWRAEFSSTTPGLTAGASDSSATECFYVNPVTPTLSTTAVDCTTDHNVLTSAVAFPGPFCDKAVLGGTANKPATNGGFNGTYTSILTAATASNGAAATGSITFTLVGPDGANQVGCPAQTTVATGTNPQQVTVSGDSSYFTSAVTVSSPGVYHWQASYGGDNPNTLGQSHNANCDQTAEDVTVQQIATEISTGPYTYPQDSASIRSSATGDLLPAGGTVVFKLFGATTGLTALQNCTANGATGLVYSETKTSVVPAGGAHEVTGINTDNTTFKIDSSKNGTYFWRVTYTTGDSAHTSRQSACEESTAVTQVDAAYPGTLFTP